LVAGDSPVSGTSCSVVDVPSVAHDDRLEEEVPHRTSLLVATLVRQRTTTLVGVTTWR
jgi:hypothetical protein